MLEIQVRYRPVLWFPITRRVKSKVPQNWDEVTQEQLIAIACLYKSIISDIAFVKAISGLKKGILERLSDFENYKIMELIDFIGEQKSHHEFIIRKISIYRKGLVLYAPCGKLKGVTFGQFIFADTYFANYQQSGDETDLNKFIGSLYIDKNEKFEEQLIQERYESIGKLEQNIRLAIALNYQLIHEWLALAYPLIFQKQSERNNDASTDKASPVSDSSSWIKVFQNFVGDDIIHDEVWAAKPVNTIFSYMTRKYKENARSHKTH